MTEIGSEFWDIPVTDLSEVEIHDGTKWFISGRSALAFIIKDIKSQRNVKSAALPEWCCDSMIIPFLDEKIKVVFYSVFLEGKIKQNIKNGLECDILFVMDYFGFQNSPIFDNYNGIIIRDLTHSLFTRNYCDADYYFGSFRKWCGVWTGGFAWSTKGWKLKEKVEESNGEYIFLRKSAMEYKKKYILGKSTSKDFLELFERAEEYLESNGKIQKAVDRDVLSIKRLDTFFIRKKRIENAKVLLNGLKNLGVHIVFSKIESVDCPMFMPILIEGRDKVRNSLIENRIYCPVHWPITGYHCIREEANRFYSSELSLVCDQRYNIEDMERQLRCLQMTIL